MSDERVATVSAERTGKVISSLRRVVSTGEYSELVALTIPPGGEMPEETHDGSDQAVFIVEGRGEATLNGRAEPADEHDAVFIPAGTRHSIKNSGVRDLKMFLVYSPPLENDAGVGSRGPGTRNFYAIAQSTTLSDSDQSGNDLRPFPGSIKWSRWKSTTLRNVLYATDLTTLSDMVLPYAISIARHFRSTLLVAHVVNSDGYGLMAPDVKARVSTGVKEAAALQIAGLMRSTSLNGVQYEPVVGEGAIVDTLLDIARQRSVDLIVLGTRGRRGLDQLLLGSVAEKLFRLATCPVLTVGRSTPHFNADADSLDHILYPMELSADVPEAAAHALSIAKAYDANLTFLNVIERPVTSEDERAWINVAAQHWFHDKVAPDLGLGERVQFVQKFGDPAAAILQCAKQAGADLIVMNVHGAHPIVAGHLPGIAYRVVTEAPCPVLTIR